MLFFLFGRLIFFLYHLDKFNSISLTEFIGIFTHSLRLDFSASSYIVGIPVILLFFYHLTGRKNFNLILKYYFIIIIAYICLITIGELELYKEWGAKLSYKALKYLSRPSEVISTAGWRVMFTGLLLLSFYFTFSFYIFIRYVYINLENRKMVLVSPFMFLLTGAATCGIGLRGGLQQIPINQSECYFSSNNDLNVVATNSFWNFMNSIYQNISIDTDHNPYQYYTDEEAQKTLANMFRSEKDTSWTILSTPRPNVVLVILESWSADLIKYTNGDSGIAPEFESLCDSGFLFTQCFGSGDRSEQGMASIWSGFPAQPEHSIISQPDKFQHLPVWVNTLKKHGYQTGFMFGGQLIYGNIKGYMRYNSFDQLREGNDFSGYPEGKLGIPDEYMFRELTKSCNSSRQPFLQSIFTLSSHMPYDMPMQEVIKKGGDEKSYLNSVYYTDRCIGEFIKTAKTQPWYKNTLFIFVADHAHPTHLHKDPFISRHHHIPLLFFGNVIKPEYRGHKYEKMIQQHDLVATLLHQLKLPYQEFVWSRNILNPYMQEFAFMPYSPDGFIYMRPENEYSIDRFRGNVFHHNFIKDSSLTEQLLREGKSYMQEVFRQYLAY